MKMNQRGLFFLSIRHIASIGFLAFACAGSAQSDFYGSFQCLNSAGNYAWDYALAENSFLIQSATGDFTNVLSSSADNNFYGNYVTCSGLDSGVSLTRVPVAPGISFWSIYPTADPITDFVVIGEPGTYGPYSGYGTSPVDRFHFDLVEISGSYTILGGSHVYQGTGILRDDLGVYNDMIANYSYAYGGFSLTTVQPVPEPSTPAILAMAAMICCVLSRSLVLRRCDWNH